MKETPDDKARRQALESITQRLTRARLERAAAKGNKTAQRMLKLIIREETKALRKIRKGKK